MNVRIGITTSFSDGEQRLRRDYVRAVERAGACPVPLPMVASAEAVQALAGWIDGLVITGGPAVVDGLNGTLPDDIDPPDPVRSASDRQYVDALWASEAPILGICYGMQLLNAYAGGTIYADVERQHEGAMAHSQKRGATSHPVHLVSGSRLRDVLGVDTVSVNTRHLQAISTVGTGFVAIATAPDGVVEAIEHENGRILGVQFHPERMGDDMLPLFRSFVHQAKRRHASSSAPHPPATLR